MNAESDAGEARGLRVHGRVQGVGFRWWTRRLGLRLGLVGDVRNLGSGEVEVHVFGEAEALDAFERALLGGPPMSKVTRLERIDADPGVPRDDFHIEYL